MNTTSIKEHAPRLGVALGSGASRGLAHIGVLQALDEADIPIHCIAGSSIGSLIGATYAAGSIDMFRQFMSNVNWKVMTSYLDFNFPQKGLIEGRRLTELIRSMLPDKTFDDLEIPFCAVATNLSTGKEVHLREGSLVDAIRASISMPGILNPAMIDDTYLVDGGLVNPVPVDVVRAMGADVVLAVDLNHDLITRNGRKKKLKARRKPEHEESKFLTRASNANWFPPKLEEKYRNLEVSVRQSITRWLEDKEDEDDRDPNIFDVIANSINIMEYQITQNKLGEHPPDVLIQPKLGHLNLFDYDEAEATIREGVESTRRELDRLGDLLHHPKPAEH